MRLAYTTSLCNFRSRIQTDKVFLINPLHFLSFINPTEETTLSTGSELPIISNSAFTNLSAILEQASPLRYLQSISSSKKFSIKFGLSTFFGTQGTKFDFLIISRASEPLKTTKYFKDSPSPILTNLKSEVGVYAKMLPGPSSNLPFSLSNNSLPEDTNSIAQYGNFLRTIV